MQFSAKQKKNSLPLKYKICYNNLGILIFLECRKSNEISILTDIEDSSFKSGRIFVYLQTQKF